MKSCSHFASKPNRRISKLFDRLGMARDTPAVRCSSLQLAHHQHLQVKSQRGEEGSWGRRRSGKTVPTRVQVPAEVARQVCALCRHSAKAPGSGGMLFIWREGGRENRGGLLPPFSQQGLSCCTLYMRLCPSGERRTRELQAAGLSQARPDRRLCSPMKTRSFWRFKQGMR